MFNRKLKQKFKKFYALVENKDLPALQNEFAKMSDTEAEKINRFYSEEGFTLLHRIFRDKNDTNDELGIIELLLENGADPNQGIKHNGKTMLVTSMRWLSTNKKCAYRQIDLLLNANADINIADDDGWSPLVSAVIDEKRGIGITKKMLENGADITVKLKYDNSNIFNWVGLSRNPELVKLLASWPGAPDIDNADCDGSTGLSKALYHKQKQMVKAFLEAGADPNQIAGRGDSMTVMYEAVIQDRPDLIQMLADYGGKVNVADKYGNTPLHEAIDRSKKTVEKLLELGADIDTQDKFGQMPLHYAVIGNKHSIVKTLLQNGADLNIKDGNNCTPLALADSDKLKKILENAGADPNLVAEHESQGLPYRNLARLQDFLS